VKLVAVKCLISYSMSHFASNTSVFSHQILYHVRIGVFTAVTMKNAVFWDVAPCWSWVNRRFGRTYHLHLQGRKIREQGTIVSRWLQVQHGTTSQKTAVEPFVPQYREAPFHPAPQRNDMKAGPCFPWDGTYRLVTPMSADRYHLFRRKLALNVSYQSLSRHIQVATVVFRHVDITLGDD
jgi:hypothetical protein